MRQLLALALLATLLASAAPAAAGYQEGSALEVNAPGTLSSRVDALVTQGVASFVSTDDRTRLEASVTARQLRLTHYSVYACQGNVATCALAQRDAQMQTLTLTDATVSVRALQAFKLIVDNSAQPASPIVASTGGAATLLDATREAVHLSPYNDGWSGQQPGALTDHVYRVEATQAFVATKGGALRAAGDFEVLVHGVEVTVAGKDADGKSVTKTYRALRTLEGDGTRHEFIVLDATTGALHAASQADIAAYQLRALDLPRGRADFTGATGTVRGDNGKTDYEDESLTLTGPLEIVITNVKAGSPPRIAFALSSQLRVLDGTPIPEQKETTLGELAAAGAAGAGGAGLLAAALFYWPRLRFALSAFMLPLYTRITRTDVLEHEKRDEIYGLIRESPGIHAHEIGERARIGWGTTVYHLKLLENHSLVVSKKSGRYKRFFVNTGEYTKKKDVYGALRNETAKSVADFIVNHPGTTQKELCAALGIQPSLASWHVQKLEAVELVKRVKDGRLVRYYAGAAWSDLNVRISPTGGADIVAET